jgi:hypothetical protein
MMAFLSAAVYANAIQTSLPQADSEKVLSAKAVTVIL